VRIFDRDDKTEDARVEKKNGGVVGPYKALFARGTIIIGDAEADVEEGDTILRLLPNGRDERNYVTKAQFYKNGKESHYQIEFRKGGAPVENKPVHNINISGTNAVQIGDYNNQDIANSFELLFQKIESSSASPEDKMEAKSLLTKGLSHPLVAAVLGTVTGNFLS